MQARPPDLSELSLDQLIELERRAEEREAAAGGNDTGGGGAGDGDDDDGDDDTIVLAWWQHPVNVVTMLVATLLIAGMIGWMIGDSTATPDANDVDIGFLQDMRLHHEQGVDMARRYVARPAVDPQLAVVAHTIVQDQTIEIGRMIEMLRSIGAAEANEGETSMAWMGMSSPVGEMPGMASAAQLDALDAASGADADRLFAELMIAHHQGGIHMAEFAADNGEHPAARRFATAIVAGQGDEIVEIRGLLDA